jgi:hypothetical protein
MQKEFITIGSTICMALFPLAVHAAAPTGEIRRHGFYELLLIYLPAVLTFATIFIFLPALLRRITKNPELDRYNQHMQNVETQLQRIAEALEKRDKDGGAA